MLPEIHGFEICRQLKTSERFRHIPVILVSGVHTGWRFAADVKEKYGADEFIEKPFETSELLRRVERGEIIEVTDRGRAVAVLSPAPEGSPLERLRACGDVEPAVGDIDDLPDPLVLPPRVERPSAVLGRLRRDER